ncbi:coagulation factor XIII B chain [Struthio camelus]|uniref:coagulation factor XIII B chain n=1 Tax=Struthio camelus TaxID=8801 RepID=UPI00360415F1
MSSGKLFAEEKCNKPPLENGVFYGTEVYFKLQEKLQYKCNPGYYTPSGESCRVPDLHHGYYFTTQQELQVNETLLYKCDEGYHTAGGNTTEEVVCLAHGWSLTPNCTNVRNKCPPPPRPPHSHIIAVLRTYHNGDKVHIQCQSNFETRGTEEIQCEKGKWTSPPICIGTMEKWEPEPPPSLEENAALRASKTYHSEDTKMQQNCTSPPVIRNSILLGPLLTSYKNGSSVEYSCQRYHFLDGPSTVYCEQGNWTQQPTCLDFYILEPCTLNATSMNSNNIELKWRQEELIFLHGDLIEFECKQGYNFPQTTISSPGRTQCNRGRLKYPKCVAQASVEKCGSPPSVANGALTLPPLTEYDSGSSVQYSCSDYHFLQGSERIYCSEGQWTSPPVCIDLPNYGARITSKIIINILKILISPFNSPELLLA